MWLQHWNLDRDPFDPRLGEFIATPAHSEAVARLVQTIETGGRVARLEAPAGMGKSTVLARAIEATRGPRRRFARATAPDDGAGLFATLAIGLGSRIPGDATRPSGWRALRDSFRLCRFQNLQIVLAIDASESIERDADRADMDRLEHLDPDPSAPLTILRVGRPGAVPSAASPSAGWELAIRLDRLSRAEAAHYLAAKLRAAGRVEPTFTARALTRLHALAEGIPRGLDRLACLSLMGSAVRGLDVVPAEVVEAASRECLGVIPTAVEV